MKRTTNIKNLDFETFKSKFRKIYEGYYFSDGIINITVKWSKYNNQTYDFIGNDGIWTNYIEEDELWIELWEYYNSLKKEV